MNHSSHGCVPASMIAPLTALGAGPLAVYVALASFCRGSKRTCWPSLTALSELTGLHRRNVQRALDRLEAAGMIAVTRRRRGARNLTNTYEVYQSVRGGGACATTPGGATMHLVAAGAPPGREKEERSAHARDAASAALHRGRSAALRQEQVQAMDDEFSRFRRERGIA